MSGCADSLLKSLFLSFITNLNISGSFRAGMTLGEGIWGWKVRKKGNIYSCQCVNVVKYYGHWLFLSQHAEEGTAVLNHAKPLRTNIHIHVKDKFFRLIFIHSFKIS